jgi:hypothetical protein
MSLVGTDRALLDLGVASFSSTPKYIQPPHRLSYFCTDSRKPPVMILFIYLIFVLGMELRASYMLSMHFTTELVLLCRSKH